MPKPSRKPFRPGSKRPDASADEPARDERAPTPVRRRSESGRTATSRGAGPSAAEPKTPPRRAEADGGASAIAPRTGTRVAAERRGGSGTDASEPGRGRRREAPETEPAGRHRREPRGDDPTEATAPTPRPERRRTDRRRTDRRRADRTGGPTTSEPRRARRADEPSEEPRGTQGREPQRDEPHGASASEPNHVDRVSALRAQITALREELARLAPRAPEAATGASPDDHGRPLRSPPGDGGSEPPGAPEGDEPAEPIAPPRPSQAQLLDECGVGPQSVWNRPLAARDATRELLTSDYFVRQWGRLGVRQRNDEARDEFGLDDDVERRFSPVFKFVFRNYFRARVDGIEHIPAQGRCLVVANHTGGPVPYDGLLLRTALRLEHPAARQLRWLTEDLFHHLPFVGPFMTRLGAVRACQENAQRLLRRGYVVAVFPEGTRGAGRPYQRRYRLERFGRGGFIRLCMRTQTPLVPCAIVGAEEANPLLYRFEYATRFLRVPYIPITPTFPLLGPLGLLPAPAKLALSFGPPLDFADYGPESADDELLVGRLTEQVRATIQGMLDASLTRRRSVFFG